MNSTKTSKHKRFRLIAKVAQMNCPTLVSGIYQIEPSHRTGLTLGGRYQILGLLDRGGTSEVYLANDAYAELPVIIKMLTDEAASDTQHRERFIVGARSTMTISHSAVGRVFSVETPLDGPPYLVMEALQGESLAHYLDREKVMPQAMTLALAREAAAGLVAAHNAGIVHRDLKPGNLYLLGPQGAPTGIKIIDFGLSKDLRHVDSGPTSVNLVLGTAQFMAPEQVLADPIDARTDIYAFGVVLFDMLTGSLPFDLKLGPDLFCHQLFSPAPPPSWLLEDLDPRLEQVILRCLRKHPENRYPSMQALLDDLVIIHDCPLDGTRRISPPMLRRKPDLYLPRNAEGRSVAKNLAQYFDSGIVPRLESTRDRLPEHLVDRPGCKVASKPLHTKVSRW